MSRPPSPVVLAGRPLRRPLPHPRVSLPATDSTELHQTYLETNEVADRDEAAQISAALESLLKDNNAKVCEGALCAARNAVEGAPELFERHVPSFIGGVFDRLGDLKAPVREAGQRLLVTLMANGVRCAARFARLVPIRPRRRGERRSLRTFAVVSLRPPLAFNHRPRRLSTPTDAYELHPDNRSEPATLVGGRSSAWKHKNWRVRERALGRSRARSTTSRARATT